jgi:protein-S-isoprenylcysteine O-methyltransferase Ste14
LQILRFLEDDEMQLFPKLTLGLWNGWIFLIVFGIVFGGVVKSFPKDVIARLYDTSNWTPTQRTLTRIGKVFSVVITVLVALTPLNANAPVFWFGTAIFVLGLSGLVLALFNFRNTPADQPITQGLYKLSRNPQWVMLIVMFLGSCIAIGSWIAFLLFMVTVVCYHFRILGEERACLAQYGEAYRAYMQQIPRYFVFF